MRMNRLVILLLLLVLNGCAMKEAPPMQTYTIDMGEITALHSTASRKKVLKVSFPQMLKESLTERMAFSYSSRDKGYYQNSQWSNNIGKLIQGSLIASLQQSGLFKAVLPSVSSANADMRLESVLYDFSHHVRGEESYAVVSIVFNLVDTRTGRLLKSKHFSYKETTPTVDASGYVIAVNRAMHRLAKDLIHWLR